MFCGPDPRFIVLQAADGRCYVTVARPAFDRRWEITKLEERAHEQSSSDKEQLTVSSNDARDGKSEKPRL